MRDVPYVLKRNKPDSGNAIFRMAETVEGPVTYEEMFAIRFTANDEEYQAYVKRPQDLPPIIENWKGGNQRPQDRFRMAETVEGPVTYEEMFAIRFTANDEEYQAYVKRPQDLPPIVENWKGGNQRPQDRYRDRPYRGWERRRDWSTSYNQPRGGRSWGNYNEHRQEGRYGYNPGYNPGSQRFYSDRY